LRELHACGSQGPDRCHRATLHSAQPLPRCPAFAQEEWGHSRSSGSARRSSLVETRFVGPACRDPARRSILSRPGSSVAGCSRRPWVHASSAPETPPPVTTSDADTTAADATDPPSPRAPRPHTGQATHAPSGPHPEPGRHIGHCLAAAHHRQHRLIRLLSHAQLPHQGSVRYQPK